MNPAKGLRLFTSYALLVIVACYLSLGNLPRLLPVPGFKDSFALTEILVYVLIPLIAIYQGKALSALRIISPIAILIGLSFAWGTALHGFDMKALMYAVRLPLQLWCATITGVILFELIEDNASQVCRYFLSTYTVLLLIGAALYVLFPRSDDLWLLLNEYGIVFVGDPHVNRFYSTYFDPNYYSVIAILPVMLSLVMFRSTKRLIYSLLAVLFLVSIILSGSRSGIAAVALFLLAIGSPKLLRLASLKTTKTALRSFGLTVFAALALGPLYLDNMMRLVKRLGAMQKDPSALQRFKSFDYGLDVITDHPFLGLGYNYLAVLGPREIAFQPIDSSLLFMTANFGMVFTWLLILLGGLGIFNLTRKLPILDRFQPESGLLVRYLFVYLAICVLFASFFNNLVLYQFWLFPMVALFVYLFQLARDLHHRELASPRVGPNERRLPLPGLEAGTSLMQEKRASGRIGVVIVTWNSATTIDSCLASIPAGLPVVVVDNGSSDDTRERVAKSGAMLLAAERNLGFGAACNLGATHLDGMDLLLLNPDAALQPGSIETMRRVLDADPTIGVVGPLIRDVDGELELSWGSDPTLFREWNRKHEHARAVAAPVQPSTVDWVTGGCCLIRRSAWESVTGFDERYFLYFEDLDFCRRVRRAGYLVRLEPGATAVHARGTSSRQIGHLVERYYRASQLRYYGTYHDRFQRLGLRIYLAFKYGRKMNRSPYYRQIVHMVLIPGFPSIEPPETRLPVKSER